MPPFYLAAHAYRLTHVVSLTAAASLTSMRLEALVLNGRHTRSDFTGV